MALEQHEEYNGYVYGAPGTNVRREIGSFNDDSGGGGNLAHVSTSNPGCLGLIAGAMVMMFSFVFEWRRAELKAQTIMYQADRNLEAVVAQVTGRLEDTREHLKHGIPPGINPVHDADRGNTVMSMSPQEPASGGARVNMNAFRPNPNFDPYDADIEIEPDYNDDMGDWEDVS